jgi:hypothetical protein
MSAKASQDERMLFYLLDREIVSLAIVTHAFNESSKLAQKRLLARHNCHGSQL